MTDAGLDPSVSGKKSFNIGIIALFPFHFFFAFPFPFLSFFSSCIWTWGFANVKLMQGAHLFDKHPFFLKQVVVIQYLWHHSVYVFHPLLFTNMLGVFLYSFCQGKEGMELVKVSWTGTFQSKVSKVSKWVSKTSYRLTRASRDRSSLRPDLSKRQF